MKRVVIPDSHGSYADNKAVTAFLQDLQRLDPQEVVMLGDHVDCGGMFSAHEPHALQDQEYSYETDLSAAAEFIDQIQIRAPKARIYYIEGNHEAHIERWSVRNLPKTFAPGFIKDNAPEHRLKLKARGISYYGQHERFMGLPIPNTIKLGKCFFTHGSKASRFATASHLDEFSANVVHGHTHRYQSAARRTVKSEAIIGHCDGTLAQLQPTYMHTRLSDWVHGYGVQFVSKKSGNFLHMHVPIINGVSLLDLVTSELGSKKGNV